ncbi:MAG: lipopolysaccharide biosynthesis protein [Pseudomonadota bacterium]
MSSSQAAPAGGGARNAILGVVLNLGSYLLTRGLNLIITIALARVLAPEGMGLIAAALLAVEIVSIINGFGLRESLIYERSRSRALQTTAFLIVMVIAFIQMGLMMLGAPFATNFVDDPEIVPLLLVLALLFPITTLGVVPEAMLLKDFQFKKTAQAEAISVIFKAAFAISLVYMGYGVWGFVVGMFAGHITRTFALWLLAGWRPARPDTNVKAAIRLISYGAHIVFNTFIGFFRKRADQLAIVGAMGDAALGIYFVAARIPDIIMFGVSVTVSKIVFPTFADASENPEALRKMYFNTIYGSMLVMAPVSIGMMAISPLVVPLLFGDEWMAAIPVLLILSLIGIPQTIGWTSGDVFKATGRPELLTLLTTMQMAFTLPVVFATAFLTRDLLWIAIAMVATEAASAAMRLWAMQRYEKIGPLETMLASAKPVLAAAIMGLGVVGLQKFSGSQPLGLQLVGSLIAGVVLYPILMLAIDYDNTMRWVRLIRRSRS